MNNTTTIEDQSFSFQYSLTITSSHSIKSLSMLQLENNKTIHSALVFPSSISLSRNVVHYLKPFQVSRSVFLHYKY